MAEIHDYNVSIGAGDGEWSGDVPSYNEDPADIGIDPRDGDQEPDAIEPDMEDAPEHENAAEALPQPRVSTVRSAVAYVETAGGEVVLQRRPGNLPAGTLAYPGMLQFLGGHANDIRGKEPEALDAAVLRELGEETVMHKDGQVVDEDAPDAPVLTAEPVWEGQVLGTGKNDEPVLRTVGLFKVVLGENVELVLKPQEQGDGGIVVLPKTEEALEAHAAEMTPFAYKALKNIITGDNQWA